MRLRKKKKLVQSKRNDNLNVQECEPHLDFFNCVAKATSPHQKLVACLRRRPFQPSSLARFSKTFCGSSCRMITTPTSSGRAKLHQVSSRHHLGLPPRKKAHTASPNFPSFSTPNSLVAQHCHDADADQLRQRRRRGTVHKCLPRLHWLPTESSP